MLPPMVFDASIGLTAARLATSALNPADAVMAVRAAVRCLPGADHVDVEWLGEVPAYVEDRWLAVYVPGRSERLPDAEADRARSAIEAAITAALDPSACA